MNFIIICVMAGCIGMGVLALAEGNGWELGIYVAILCLAIGYQWLVRV